ncbi:MAG: AEC family transporter [Hyphomicrobiales bacterium]
MNDILSLALPFFGLIFLGYVSGKLVHIPEEGLAWLNFFIIYIALPSLFFLLIAETPIEQLANWAYVATTTFSTYCGFAIAFAIGVLATRGNIPESTIMGIAGAYSNVGYMGPGLTLASLGPDATVPTTLIFCFDNALLFTLAPLMMAIGGTEKKPIGQVMFLAAKRVILHPFILATIAGVAAAALDFQPPVAAAKMLTYLKSAAAPCALFTLGVTVALRPLKKVPLELPAVLLVKLVIHPVIVWVLLSYVGDFQPVWIYTAILMASLPPALNVFVIARQYSTYVERASSIVLVGTLVSVFTVTGLLYLIAHGILPADLFPA